MNRKKLVASGILCFMLLFSAPSGFCDVISSTELIEGGQAYLISQQQANGSWHESKNSRHDTAVTAIALAALLDTGVSADDGVITRGVEFLMTQFNGEYFNGYHEIYATGSAVMALSMYAPPEGPVKDAIVSATQKLLDTQNMTQASSYCGSWDYDFGEWSGDLSNAQFAAMGLYYATQYLGALNSDAWKDALYEYIKKCHIPSTGATAYTPGGSSYLPSMTGASMWCLSLIGRETDPIAVGSTVTGEATLGNEAWFINNYSWDTHTPRYYFTYAWAKALTAVVGTESKLGDHDWVEDLVTMLSSQATAVAKRKGGVQKYKWVGTQSLDGGDIVGTAFAMMSMAFADINVESPEKRVSDVPDEVGPIDYPIRGLLTLKTEGGVTITGAKRGLANLFKWKGRRTLKLPVGAVEFTLHHVPAGGKVKLVIKLPRNAARRDVADSFVDENGDPKPNLNWYKIQNGQWKGVTPITIDPVAETMTVWLTNGGPEDVDGDPNNDTIVDPGAPGFEEGADEPEDLSDVGTVTTLTGSGDGICFAGGLSGGVGGFAVMGLGLCGMLAALVRRRRMK